MLLLNKTGFFSLFLLMITSAPPAAAEDYPLRSSVIFVNDGDTLRLSDGKYVRLVGIDTPEKDEEFYKDAKRLCERAVLDKRVRLEYDREKKDRYGRLLAYVFFEDGGSEYMLNIRILEEGLGHIYHKRGRLRHHDRMLEAQRRALVSFRGIWRLKLSDTEDHYISSKKSAVFHRPRCRWAGMIKAENAVVYRRKIDAYWDGLSPCRGCSP